MKQEYLELFDKLFDKDIRNIKLEDKPMLKELYYYFEEKLYQPNDRYLKLKEHRNEVDKEIEKEFTSLQYNLFVEYWELDNIMASEMEKQIFLYGVIIGAKLNEELQI